jgi:hypothetical protein
MRNGRRVREVGPKKPLARVRVPDHGAQRLRHLVNPGWNDLGSNRQVRIAPERRVLLRLDMNDLGLSDLDCCRDEKFVRWQRTVVDLIREFVYPGPLLLAVTMDLVEERNVIQCVKIYEEFSVSSAKC